VEGNRIEAGMKEAEESRPSLLRNLLGYGMDWGIAIALTVAGFWLLSAVRAPDLPSQAPEWTLRDLSGESVSLTQFRGQTVVLNFWAEWCGPCRMEIPAFSSFAEEHPDIPVLGIAVDGTPSELRRQAARLGISYPVLLADNGIQEDYKVTTLPTTVIVGPDGEVRNVHVGAMLGPQLRWATR
jgi:thiol-disulfide isomerase/thioredoxin